MREGASAKADRALVPSGPEPVPVSASGNDPLRVGARRIAPAAGYDTEAKARYRERVWSAMRGGLAPYGKVLILPSSEGLEIDILLSSGVGAGEVICVDRSAAVIATSKWRKKHPTIKFHASDIATVGRKLAAGGDRVAFANLDLCGQVSQETVDQVKSFLRITPLEPHFRLAITVAKGRESPALATLMKALPATGSGPSCGRLRALLYMIGLRGSDTSIRVLDEGSYTSGRHPMSWAVFDVERYDAAALLKNMRGRVSECLADVCERVLGWIDEGEFTEVCGEHNYTLADAIYELHDAFGEEEVVDAPRKVRRKVIAGLASDWPEMKTEDWRRVLSLYRVRARRACDSGRHAQRGDPSGAPSEGCQSGGATSAASPTPKPPKPPNHPSNREAT